MLALGDAIQLVAVADCSEPHARALSQQYTGGRARVFLDHHALFHEMDVDLLVVCLPPFAHSDEVEQAAARGVHLLMEKPIAVTSDKAWEMVRTAERAGIRTQVGFMYRFGEAVERFKADFDAGKIGPAGLFSASYLCNSLHADWWRHRDQSGGQLVEQVIHLFDIMRYLLGDPVTVYSRQSNAFHRDLPDYTIEDTSATVMSFANGALGVIYATNGAIPGKWLKAWRIVTAKRVADFTDWNHATFTPTEAPGLSPEIVVSEQDVFVLQLQDLVQAIRTGGATRTPLRQGARSLDLVLAATRSAETGAEIRIGS